MLKRATSGWLILVGALGLVLGVANAGTRELGTPSDEFKGQGPGGFTLHGKTDQLLIQDDGSLLRIVVPLATLHTGIGLRDRHMREKYLQTDKFPTAVLEVPWSQVRLPEDGQLLQATGHGRLTLHGVTRDADFQYQLSRKADQYQVTGSLPVNIEDYGIADPSYLGLTVQPQFAVSVVFSAQRR